jgi:hypothetical protein
MRYSMHHRFEFHFGLNEITYFEMKAYITKYCLTGRVGIQEVSDAIECGKGMVSVPSLGCSAYFHGEGTEWHKTKESAIARAEQMRLARIMSFRKAIMKLKSLKFT